jgi:hypothetical protein
MHRFTFLAVVLVACGVTFAQTTGPEYQAPSYYYPVQAPPSPWQYDVSFTAGYSNFLFQHTNNLNFSRDGAFIDLGFNFNVPQVRPFVFGVGLTASGFWDNYNLFFQSLYSEFNTATLEARVALPLAPNPNKGFFFTPRLGAGGMLDNYYVQTGFGGYINYNGAAFVLRPGAQLGWRFGAAAVGVDGSYMAAWGNFGDLGHFAQELRIGLFFSYRF